VQKVRAAESCSAGDADRRATTIRDLGRGRGGLAIKRVAFSLRGAPTTCGRGSGGIRQPEGRTAKPRAGHTSPIYAFDLREDTGAECQADAQR